MIIEIILLMISCLFVIYLFMLTKKPEGTPPGTNGIPIIGTLPSHNQTLESFISFYRKKYGDIFWLKLGTGNNVFLSKYDDILAAFNNPSLQGRTIFYSIQLLYKFGNKDVQQREKHMHKVLGIINSEGDSWKNVRRFVIRRLRDGGMGKSSMESIILDEAEYLAEDFEKYVDKPTTVPWSINASILNVTWRLVGSKRFDIFDEEVQNLMHYISDILSDIQDKFFLFDLFGWLYNITPNFILNFIGKKQIERKVELVYKLLHRTVDEHKETIDVNNPRDLIDSYLIDLQKQEKNSSNKSDNTFSERELVQSIFDLFVAGSETTSSTIKWFILFMAKYPKIQKKLHEEIDNAISKDKMVSIEDKEKLTYLECCICETLRSKPILPIGLVHEATEDTQIGGYNIPKGTQVSANIVGVHTDPLNWEKPNEFYPEHFLNDNGTFNKKKELITFSVGRRVCVGESLARMDLYYILATLMQRFTFSAADGEPLSTKVSPKQPIFMLPQPFKIVISRRGEVHT